MALDRFKFERLLLKQGVARIAGIDEAGRGPLAGPVVAGAVIFPRTWIQEGLPVSLRGLNDSKQLKETQRDSFYEALTTTPEVQWGVAVVPSTVIDTINILQATLRAMNEAWTQLDPGPEHSLVDGVNICSVKHPQTAIVEGDSKSFSIAAASVIAKVTRDRLMASFAREYPAYGFGENKGYGTKQHMEALQRVGPCPIHRMTFAPLRPRERDLFA